MIALAAWCSLHGDKRRTFGHGFFLPLLIVGLPIGLISSEVDLGNASLLTVACLAVLFVAGARTAYVLGVFALAGAALAAAVHFIPERMGRVLAITDLEKYKSGDGLQQWLSLVALGTGGDAGAGLGNSRQKMWSLPYPNSDFIFPIIGEELGLGFSLVMVFCYVVITVCGIVISLHAPDRFGKLLGFGLCTLLVLQAVTHLGVTTALLPNKGMPLPLVSAGGSNLIALMFGFGILLNIFRQGRHYAVESMPVLAQRKYTPAV
jgi:cell division protein FtsW